MKSTVHPFGGNTDLSNTHTHTHVASLQESFPFPICSQVSVRDMITSALPILRSPATMSTSPAALLFLSFQ